MYYDMNYVQFCHPDEDASLLLSITVDDNSKRLSRLEETVARMEASGMFTIQLTRSTCTHSIYMYF